VNVRDWQNPDSKWHAHPSNHRLVPGGSEYESRYLWVRDQVKTGTRGLDVGCNCGQLIVNLSRDLGCKMVGVDIIDEFVKHCQTGKAEFGEYHTMDFSRVDFEVVDRLFLGREFDFVTALEVIEHPISVRGFRDRVLHVLRPGGRLIVTTPHPKSASYGYEYYLRHPHHVRMWTYQRLQVTFGSVMEVILLEDIYNQGKLAQIGAVFRKPEER